MPNPKIPIPTRDAPFGYQISRQSSSSSMDGQSNPLGYLDQVAQGPSIQVKEVPNLENVEAFYSDPPSSGENVYSMRTMEKYIPKRGLDTACTSKTALYETVDTDWALHWSKLDRVLRSSYKFNPVGKVTWEAMNPIPTELELTEEERNFFQSQYLRYKLAPAVENQRNTLRGLVELERLKKRNKKQLTIPIWPEDTMPVSDRAFADEVNSNAFNSRNPILLQNDPYIIAFQGDADRSEDANGFKDSAIFMENEFEKEVTKTSPTFSPGPGRRFTRSMSARFCGDGVNDDPDDLDGIREAGLNLFDELNLPPYSMETFDDAGFEPHEPHDNPPHDLEDLEQDSIVHRAIGDTLWLDSYDWQTQNKNGLQNEYFLADQEFPEADAINPAFTINDPTLLTFGTEEDRYRNRFFPHDAPTPMYQSPYAAHGVSDVPRIPDSHMVETVGHATRAQRPAISDGFSRYAEASVRESVEISPLRNGLVHARTPRYESASLPNLPATLNHPQFGGLRLPDRPVRARSDTTSSTEEETPAARAKNAQRPDAALAEMMRARAAQRQIEYEDRKRSLEVHTGSRSSVGVAPKTPTPGQGANPYFAAGARELASSFSRPTTPTHFTETPQSLSPNGAALRLNMPSQRQPTACMWSMGRIPTLKSSHPTTPAQAKKKQSETSTSSRAPSRTWSLGPIPTLQPPHGTGSAPVQERKHPETSTTSSRAPSYTWSPGPVPALPPPEGTAPTQRKRKLSETPTSSRAKIPKPQNPKPQNPKPQNPKPRNPKPRNPKPKAQKPKAQKPKTPKPQASSSAAATTPSSAP